MSDERTKAEAERLAAETAQRLMAKPPQPHEWPKKKRPKVNRDGASKPRKREPSDAGS